MIASAVLDQALSLAAATPSPTPLPYNPDDVTPGVVGFMFTFVIFVLVGLIAWDMLRRVRNMRYRDEVRRKLEAEVAATRGEGATESSAADAQGASPDEGPAPEHGGADGSPDDDAR